VPRYKVEDITFYNESPITDAHEALDIFFAEQTHRTPIHLFRSVEQKGREREYRIVIPWYREGSSGGDTSGESYYQIDVALAEQMISEQFVVPMKVLSWGRTDIDSERFVLNYLGERKSKAFDKAMLEKAESMLTVGIHTDLAGKPERTSYGREGFRCGRFYVDFRTPHEETCRVYPEQEELVCPFTYTH
jgi:hypothetical protein